MQAAEPTTPQPDPIRAAIEALAAGLAKLVRECGGEGFRPTPELLTRQETAAFLNISLASLTDLERNGGLGPEPVQLGLSGRLLRYRRQELLDWLAAGAPLRVRWQEMKRSYGRRAG